MISARRELIKNCGLYLRIISQINDDKLPKIYNDFLMATMNSWRGLPDGEIEEWFLNHLPESKTCFNELLEVVVRFAEKNQPERAEACADLLEDALKKNAAGDELLLFLERRAGWQSDANAYAAACARTLAGFFQGQNLMQIFLEACGLQGGIQPQEALRRLCVLRELSPGKCCYEKTWGLGTVAGIDEFDRKLVINFEGKQAHRLAFSYAAEMVQPIADRHLLALKLRDAEAFQRCVKDNPAEAVKAILRQFGAMSPVRLRALMIGLVLPEKEWSSFWAAARAKLSSDPLIQMPARSRCAPSAAGGPAGRNDPIRILAEKKEFDGQWRDNFSALRDVDRILSEIELLFKHCPPQSLAGDFKKAVEDRLKFVVRGIGAEQQNVIIQALLFADAAGIAGEIVDVSAYAEEERLLVALNSLPARNIKPFLACLEKKSVPITGPLFAIMPKLLFSALNEMIQYCRQSGKEEQLFAGMRAILRERKVGSEMISWIGGNLRLVCEKEVLRPEDFAPTALEVLQRAATSGRKKDVGQLLRQVFTDKALLKEMLQPLDNNQRLDFSRRLNALAGLTAADKMEIAAKIIPLFPDLAGAFSAPVVSLAGPKLTSYRSYREKQAQLEKIIKEEIPRNSKEIGVARSYGDLRENFEYKAAREMQGLLMRRKVDLEQMLSEVRGADFADLPHDIAGQGTGVELKMPDGSKPVYYILGEFDADEKLGIISCRSKLAEALGGHRAGDSVEIPGENSPVNCVLEAIHELSPEIKAWINGA